MTPYLLPLLNQTSNITNQFNATMLVKTLSSELQSLISHLISQLQEYTGLPESFLIIYIIFLFIGVIGIVYILREYPEFYSPTTTYSKRHPKRNSKTTRHSKKTQKIY